MSNKNVLVSKLMRARKALDLIVSRILEINKAKRQHQISLFMQGDWREELRILNLIADRQARIVRVYESRLELLI